MNPFKDIQTLDRIIKNLKYQLRYSKNKKESERVIKQLSEVRNNFNKVFNETFNVDILETLLLEVVLTRLKLDDKIDNYEIYNLDTNLAQLGQIIKEGKDLKASELINYLKAPYEKLMLKDYENNEDLLRVKKLIERVPSNEYFLNLLNEFTNILKTDIRLMKN